MPEFEPILAGGRCLNVRVVETANENSYASVSNGEVVIRIPRRLGDGKAEELAQKMYLRMKKGLERHPNRYIGRELAFSDGKAISIMGASFCMHISEDGRRNGSGRIRGQDIYISLPWSLPDEKRGHWIASLARRLVYPALRERLREYVRAINSRHFNSEITDVRLHGGSSRWGYYRPDGVISLGFELLFMPEECIEYVVVHELAHTKVRGHSRRFWDIVESVMPDYRERRKRLNDCGYSNQAQGGLA